MINTISTIATTPAGARHVFLWRIRTSSGGCSDPKILLSCLIFCVGAVISIMGCHGGSVGPVKKKDGDHDSVAPWFADVTDEVGLNFVHDPGELGRFFMPESTGSGAALFDFDNDGRLDIYLVQNGGPDSGSSNKLFRQLENGSFQDASAGSGLDVQGYGMGVAVGDVNNDGKSDVFLTEYGQVRLFLNQADGRFIDITSEAGIENPHWGTSACFFDYDRDGWLDLVVANYVDYAPTQQCFDQSGKLEYCGPSGFPPTISRLFRNLGSNERARFEDVTRSSGIARVPGPALGVVCADFNGDRWPDILFADDAAKNRLWINQQGETFQEEAVERGIAYNAMGQTQANMGIALGDANGDGHLDIFVTHLNTETHALWQQSPQGMFQDQSGSAGVTRTKWRGTAFGTVFGDFDHDGAVDLALVNGAIKRVRNRPEYPHLGRYWSPYAEQNQLLRNDGNGVFSDLSPMNSPFCGTPAVARGLACADIDEDGALDLLVTNIGSAAKLYRNVAPARGRWLMVRAVDPKLGGRDAYGAKITVETNGWRLVRWLNPAFSYLCSNDPRCHFGLGQHDQVERIQIIWPDGTEEEFGPVDANQSLVLKRGAGR